MRTLALLLLTTIACATAPRAEDKGPTNEDPMAEATEMEAMQPPQKTAEHEWLAKLAGQWSWVMEVPAPEEGKPAWAGVADTRMLGDLWIVSEWGDTEGSKESASIQTIGYDPDKGSFVGTFISAMGTHLWLYEGRLEDDRKALVLEAEGPHMSHPGKKIPYRDIIRLQGPDEYVLESEYLEDGTWKNFMRAIFKRKK